MVSLKQAVTLGMVFTSATLIGYDSGYLNGVLASEDFIQRYGVREDGGDNWYLTARTRALFTSMFAPGTIVGCLLASAIADRVGRKGSFLLAAIACMVGVSVQAAGPPSSAFIVARLVHGIGLGLISIVVLTCGNVVACAISLATSNLSGSKSWRITIAFQLSLALFVFLGAIIVPESPTILLRRGKIDDATRSVLALRNLQPGSTELHNVLQEVQAWLTEENSFGKVDVKDCFRGTNLRRTLVGVGMAFMTLATGINFWFGYGVTFFEAAGVKNAYLISLILPITNCVFTAPSIYLIEKIGRRALMFAGGAVMALSEILTAVIHTVAPGSTASTNMILAGTIMFIAGYASSWGPAGWLLMAEPYSARLRTHSTTLSMIVYWVTTWGVGFVTPYIVDETAANLGVNITYIWFATTIISLIWAYLCVPELAGLSTAEVDILFEEKVPAWKSIAWKKELQIVEGAVSPEDGPCLVFEPSKEIQ
ncbi:glucose transporter [Neofusicoccum parvum]|uniref:Glucose transporter n=1 Tax=Neofusicoccum parvum TaxID=310453 RepID=A0ACB5SAI5_9PEZI|nr:glucose transporter [Neofusicoccum parvum]